MDGALGKLSLGWKVKNSDYICEYFDPILGYLVKIPSEIKSHTKYFKL